MYHKGIEMTVYGVMALWFVWLLAEQEDQSHFSPQVYGGGDKLDPDMMKYKGRQKNPT